MSDYPKQVFNAQTPGLTQCLVSPGKFMYTNRANASGGGAHLLHGEAVDLLSHPVLQRSLVRGNALPPPRPAAQRPEMTKFPLNKRALAGGVAAATDAGPGAPARAPPASRAPCPGSELRAPRPSARGRGRAGRGSPPAPLSLTSHGPAAPGSGSTWLSGAGGPGRTAVESTAQREPAQAPQPRPHWRRPRSSAPTRPEPERQGRSRVCPAGLRAVFDRGLCAILGSGVWDGGESTGKCLCVVHEVLRKIESSVGCERSDLSAELIACFSRLKETAKQNTRDQCVLGCLAARPRLAALAIC